MIRLGILGYGNLGRGVEWAVRHNADMELVAVFTRRDPKSLSIGDASGRVPAVYSADELAQHRDEIDVLIVCGGSATDLPEQTPMAAAYYNVIDSFDTHARIPEHLKRVEEATRAAGTTAVISVGWDPGLFSIARLYGNAVLTGGRDYTFWGRGVSQGHSDAVRRIEGVIDARQYTIPVPAAVEAVREGSLPELTTREKHTREVFVVAEEGADRARIEREIVTMPNYFSDYDTTVHFIDAETMKRDHSGLPHGGSVIRSGRTGANDEFNNTVEFSLKLDSNPAFTASVLVAYARAAYRMNRAGMTGCKTVLDIPPVMLMQGEREDIISHLV